jgi:phosphatidate cytidylyltransferase
MTGMLLQRVVTALVLVALLLLSLAARAVWPFAMLTLVLIAAAGWEWGRLNQAPDVLSWVIGFAMAAAGGWAVSQGWTQRAPSPVWWSAAVLWPLAGVVALRAGPTAWPQLPKLARWCLGVLALWAAWLALAQARAIGINFLLSVLCLVWMADVSAYFGGRAFGRRKLAPSISPGKSWEGVWSGMAGVMLLAVFWVWLDGRSSFDSHSMYSRLLHSLGWAGATVAVVTLCGLSVVGDLVESLVKRAAGAKDSSRLLPGHGGVLDRVDALLPVLPVALAAATLGSL